MSIIDPNSPGLFSFFAPKAGGPGTYQSMEARRRIALQLLANSRKGYPKTVGEGLTAIGDAIGDRAVLNQLAQQESAYQQAATAGIPGMVPPEARTTPGPVSATEPATPPASTAEVQTPVQTAELTPEEQTAGVVGSDVSVPGPPPEQDATRNRIAVALTGQPPDNAHQSNLAYLGRYGGHTSTLVDGKITKTDPGAAGNYAPVHPELAARLAAAGRTFEQETGKQPKYDEMSRGNDVQAIYYNRYVNGTGGIAAPPGRSNHQKGLATDLPDSDFRRWLNAGNQARFGLHFPVRGDPPHVQMNPGYRGPDFANGSTVVAAAAPPPQAAQMTPPAQPLTTADAAESDLLGEVTGMGGGDRGYSYPPTASLGRTGDVMSDAPPVTGISPNVGAAVADTVQQQRDAVARARLQPAPASLPMTTPSPQPPGVVSDIVPAPPPPGAQLAQAGPAGALPPVRAPLTDLPQRPVPPPVTTGPPEPRLPIPADIPMSNEEKQGWQIRARGVALGDPNLTQQGQALIDYGAGQRKQLYDARVRDYQDALLARRQKELADEAFTRAAPERELARQRAELELAKGKAFGGLSEEAVLKPVTDSAKAVAGIPQGQVAVRNALRVLPNVFTGSSADVNLSLAKILESAGFPANPKIPATEQFKAFIMPALAAARQAQSGGANISDNDMALAAKAVAGDIKLDRASIQGILEELQRVNVKAAIWHQGKVEAAAGDDPQRQAFMLRSYGLPMQDLVDPGAIKLLRERPTPDVIEQFNRKYHTPGLAQQILGGG
jgi:hypothetical protein